MEGQPTVVFTCTSIGTLAVQHLFYTTDMHSEWGSFDGCDNQSAPKNVVTFIHTFNMKHGSSAALKQKGEEGYLNFSAFGFRIL